MSRERKGNEGRGNPGDRDPEDALDTKRDLRAAPVGGPRLFLKVGERVLATDQIRQRMMKGDTTVTITIAEPYDKGVVEFTEPDFWPTVRFHRSGWATTVTPDMVAIDPDPEET